MGRADPVAYIQVPGIVTVGGRISSASAGRLVMGFSVACNTRSPQEATV